MFTILLKYLKKLYYWRTKTSRWYLVGPDSRSGGIPTKKPLDLDSMNIDRNLFSIYKTYVVLHGKKLFLNVSPLVMLLEHDIPRHNLHFCILLQVLVTLIKIKQ